MVGFCYHFALLHCALLRATGTPARIRCGFAAYFEARRWIDHWITEYRDGGQWKRTDPQTGRGDLASDDFQDGITAWDRCDRLKVEPLDQPHDEPDTSLDILARLAAAAESAETIKECLDLYPDLRPPADAVAR